ncbi:MAG: M50 family metallopeptidase [Myxococcota bacterium]
MMRRPAVTLFVAAALNVVLWLMPFGRVIALPLLWWSTLAHEAGHGLAAVVVGGTWEKLQLFIDGSGVATSRYDSRSDAIVALGGLVGPAAGAFALFLAGAFQRPARLALAVLGGAVLALLPTVASGWFTVVFILGAGGVLCLISARASTTTAQVGLLFLAVQLALSVFSRADYLFTATAVTGAGTFPSDIAKVASQLGGSYVVWGVCVAAVSVLVLVCGLASLFLVDRITVVWERFRGRLSPRHGGDGPAMRD